MPSHCLPVGWRLAKAVVRGTSHEASGTPCQDYVQCGEFELHGGEGKILVVALADGAGSAKLSAQGARCACDEVVLSIQGDEPRLREASGAKEAIWAAFERARRQVDELAAREEAPLREFASTLLIAVLAPWGAAFGQLGDGAIAFDGGDGLALAFEVEQEMVNVTNFLTDPDAEANIRVRIVEAAISRLAVTSDGLIGLLIDQRKRQPHPPAFDMLFAAFSETQLDDEIDEGLRSLLGSTAVNDRTDDDKSIVLAVRADGR